MAQKVKQPIIPATKLLGYESNNRVLMIRLETQEHPIAYSEIAVKAVLVHLGFHTKLGAGQVEMSPINDSLPLVELMEESNHTTPEIGTFRQKSDGKSCTITRRDGAINANIGGFLVVPRVAVSQNGATEFKELPPEMVNKYLIAVADDGFGHAVPVIDDLGENSCQLECRKPRRKVSYLKWWSMITQITDLPLEIGNGVIKCVVRSSRMRHGIRSGGRVPRGFCVEYLLYWQVEQVRTNALMSDNIFGK
ncbi:UNVERIFIED_CONTAM: hypothetical protein Sindi_0052900 [Sesamum indicum]